MSGSAVGIWGEELWDGLTALSHSFVQIGRWLKINEHSNYQVKMNFFQC